MNALRNLARERRVFDIPQSHQHTRAFTLVELVVIIGVLAFAAATLVPALARARPNSQAFQCLNNLQPYPNCRRLFRH